MLMDKLGFDPAVASGPFITTLSDLTSVLIYFNIAKDVYALFCLKIALIYHETEVKGFVGLLEIKSEIAVNTTATSLFRYKKLNNFCAMDFCDF